jgi:prepilin-type N-terminal cleavage/methylation domain-containing protein
MTRSRQQGFTLIEMLTVMAVLGVVAVMTMGLYRQGLLRESAQSNLARGLVASLHLAKIRGLNNLAVVPITNGTYDSANTAVVFTATNHGLSTGDYVTFTDLDVHAAMNGGSYYVTTLNANQFRCLHFSVMVGSDTTGVARCLNRAGKLVIWKRSAFETAFPTTAEQAQQQFSGENFVYDDTQFLVWNGLDATATQAATYFTVSFTSRGFASVTTGYQVVVGTNPPRTGREKYVTILPSGKVQPGT